MSAISQMLKQEPLETGSRGKIVNIASIAALIGRRRHHTYSASKAAVTKFDSQFSGSIALSGSVDGLSVLTQFVRAIALTRPTNPETEQGTRLLCKIRLATIGNFRRRSPLRVVSRFSRSRVGHRNCFEVRALHEIKLSRGTLRRRTPS